MKKIVLITISLTFLVLSRAQELPFNITDDELFEILDSYEEDLKNLDKVKVEISRNKDETSLRTLEEIGFEQFLLQLENEMYKRFDLKPGETPYHYIAKTGKLNYLKFRSSYFRKYSINSESESGYTPLQFAIWRNSNNPLETVKALIENGANPKIRDKYSNTCLHLSAEYNKIDLVAYFLESGLNCNDTNTFKNTALHNAARNNNKPMIDLLLSKGATIDDVNFRLNTRNRKDSKDYSTFMHTAAMNSWTDLIDKALDAGVSINCEVYKSRYFKKATALLYAVDDNNISITKYLIEKGANIDLYEYTNGYSPLTKSIRNENKEIFDMLMAQNANVNIPVPNLNGFPIYHCFHSNDKILGHHFAKTILTHPNYIHPNSKEAEKIFYEMYSRLMAERAKMQMTSSFEKDIDDKTPLHWCAILDWGDLCELLIKKGAFVDTKDKNGYTPLQKAVQYKKHAAAKILIQNNADPKLKNNYGDNAIDIAKDKNDSEMKKILSGK